MERTPPIVTITSDFGWRDFYLARIKGSILKQTPNARIIDISHDVSNYNIVEAAYLFGAAWQAFPVGTIHIVSVNDFDQPEQPMLVFQHEGHFFIGPDNGVFSLVFDQQPSSIYSIDTADIAPDNFPLAAVFAKAAGHLAQDLPVGGLGGAVEKWLERIALRPVTGPNHIRGAVIYIDKFENVILNIDRAVFDAVGRGRPFELYFKRHSPIKGISQHFHDVAIGEVLCRFNASDRLEIAINMDKAASLLGLKIDDTVQVDFTGKM
ncbi:MAG: SAM-dependent chlorinase/fluorinase [Saprospiraceae bacterium]